MDNSFSRNETTSMSDIPREIRMGCLNNNIKLTIDSGNTNQAKFFVFQGVEALSIQEIPNMVMNSPVNNFHLSLGLDQISSQVIESVNHIPVLKELPQCYQFITSDKVIRYVFQPNNSPADYVKNFPTWESIDRIFFIKLIFTDS